MSFTSIMFYYVAQTLSRMNWRNREKQNDQQHHQKASRKKLLLSSWVLEYFLFCFVFEEMSSSLSMLLVMLFVHVGKRWNSSSNMFFKIGVLKRFAIFTGKKLRWSLFEIKLQDWRPTFLLKNRLQYRWFQVNIPKFQ